MNNEENNVIAADVSADMSAADTSTMTEEDIAAKHAAEAAMHEGEMPAVDGMDAEMAPATEEAAAE